MGSLVGATERLAGAPTHPQCKAEAKPEAFGVGVPGGGNSGWIGRVQRSGWESGGQLLTTLSLLEGLPRGAENSPPQKNFCPDARGRQGEWKCLLLNHRVQGYPLLCDGVCFPLSLGRVRGVT